MTPQSLLNGGQTPQNLLAKPAVPSTNSTPALLEKVPSKIEGESGSAPVYEPCLSPAPDSTQTTASLVPSSPVETATVPQIQNIVSTVRQTPISPPVNEKVDALKTSITQVANPRDPRKRALDQGNNQNLEKKYVSTKKGAHKMPLKEQLICHGVPEKTFSQCDGFEKMRLTFSGRVHAVKKKPVQKCYQIADCMIECCQKTFTDYTKLSNQYINARISHMEQSETTGYFPEHKVDHNDMSTTPPLLELRHGLHKQLFDTFGKGAKIPFKISELVDLLMYYFNHVATYKYWQERSN